MSEFHTGKPWQKLSKDFKTLKCVDCSSKDDIQAGHILPASRFKLMRLWKYNLVAQCRVCNAKLGNKIRWSISAVILLLIYPILWMVHMIIKFLMVLVIFLILAIVGRFIVIDLSRGPFDTTITGQILAELREKNY